MRLVPTGLYALNRASFRPPPPLRGSRQGTSTFWLKLTARGSWLRCPPTLPRKVLAQLLARDSLGSMTGDSLMPLFGVNKQVGQLTAIKPVGFSAGQWLERKDLQPLLRDTPSTIDPSVKII